MAKNYKGENFKISIAERRVARELLKEAQSKAQMLMERSYVSNKSLSIGSTLIPVDYGYSLREIKVGSFKSQKGYDWYVNSLKNFIDDNWEENQRQLLIDNFSKGIESVFGDYDNRKSVYVKKLLSKFSYDELLFMITETDWLDISYFYAMASEDVEVAYNNLVKSIAELDKRYNNLKNGK